MLPLTATTSLVMIELEQEIKSLQYDKSAVLVSQDENLNNSPDSAMGNDTHSKNSSNNNKTQRRVHFSADLEQCYQTLHKSDYTFAEKLKTWIDLDGLDEIKKERRSTIKRMNKGSKLKKSHHTRGLEGYTREGSKIRQKVIGDSIAAVKTEQANSKSENGPIAIQIAQAYSAHSLPCRLAAYERGLSDQSAADETECKNKAYQEQEAVPSDVAVGWQRS